jgi:hypothetical protein
MDPIAHGKSTTISFKVDFFGEVFMRGIKLYFE